MISIPKELKKNFCLYGQDTKIARTAMLRRAFTLVELLVTLVIGALLMLILAVTFEKVRSSSNTIRCMNNLKQHWTAWMTYANDHNGMLPTVWDPDKWGTWPMAMSYEGLMPPVWDEKNFKLWSCPSWKPYGPKDFHSTRVYGALTYYDWLDENRRLTTYDAMTPLIADSIGVESGFPNYYIPVHQPNPAAKIHLRHDGRANLIFADGHGECADAERLQQIQFKGKSISSEVLSTLKEVDAK